MELYISDLDGTLLNKNAEVSEYTKDTINSLIAEGLNFTIATARTLASAGKILSGLDLRLPIILMNGVLIYDPAAQKYEAVNSLSGKLVKEIQTAAKNLDLDCFMYTIQNNEMNTYFEKLSSDAMKSFYNERREKYYKSFTQTEDFSSVTASVIYFTFINSKEKLKPLYEKFSDNPQLEITFYDDIYSDDLWYLEVFSSKASKKQGVKYLRQKYGFESITAFGDNLNDLPMLEEAETKCAVSNAKQQLLDSADVIVLSNNEDGVAKYLQKIFGKEI